LSSLATRLLVGRLRQSVRQKPESVEAAVKELFAFFDKNSFAKRDFT